MIYQQWCTNYEKGKCEVRNCLVCKQYVPMDDPYEHCRGCAKLENPEGCDEECMIIPN